jgi:hypothetical protein
VSSIIIHNVSDRPSIGVEASAYKIAGHWLRPGKQVTVPEEAVNSKLRALHGKCLWFGRLPPVLVAESKSESGHDTNVFKGLCSLKPFD